MLTLVRTELVKLAWTRSTWALVALGLVLVLVLEELVLASVGTAEGPVAGSAGATRALLATAGVGTVVVAVLGVLVVTRDLHHGTWTSTLLVVPRRRRAVGAKLVAAAVAGSAAAALFVTVALARGLASGDLAAGADAGTVRLVAAGLVAGAWWAWVGAGIGALVGDQTVACLIPLAWLTVVETLLPAFGLDVLVPWTPRGATGALGGTEPGLLPLDLAALVLVVYGTALSATGTRRLERADVT